MIKTSAYSSLASAAQPREPGKAPSAFESIAVAVEDLSAQVGAAEALADRLCGASPVAGVALLHQAEEGLFGELQGHAYSVRSLEERLETALKRINSRL